MFSYLSPLISSSLLCSFSTLSKAVCSLTSALAFSRASSLNCHIWQRRVNLLQVLLSLLDDEQELLPELRKIFVKSYKNIETHLNINSMNKKIKKLKIPLLRLDHMHNTVLSGMSKLQKTSKKSSNLNR